MITGTFSCVTSENLTHYIAICFSERDTWKDFWTENKVVEDISSWKMKQIPIQQGSLEALKLLCDFSPEQSSAFPSALWAQILPGPSQKLACSWWRTLRPATEECSLQRSKSIVGCSILESSYIAALCAELQNLLDAFGNLAWEGSTLWGLLQK